MLKGPFKLMALILLLICLLLSSLSLSGCNEKSKKQNFVNEFIKAFKNLQSEPEIAEDGRKAAIAYLRSGCTDLKSADIARESYEKSIENDQSSLERIDSIEKPDSESKEIARALTEGINKIDEASSKFALQYKNARKQSVEERIASSQDIQPILKSIASGMEKIKKSLEMLVEYIETNGLKGKADVEEWLQNVTNQLDAVQNNIIE